MSAITKDRLYHLIEALPEREWETAARVLEALGAVEARRPLYTRETAPVDDEPETDEERRAVEEAKAELARGEGVPAADVYREFGV
jgi:hypothetical protein